ncbi:hypothetical protein PIB30_102730, partial [Stylosanthes scabra]|nr:hypothetical protein [Stylosanthes scabra]
EIDFTNAALIASRNTYNISSGKRRETIIASRESEVFLVLQYWRLSQFWCVAETTKTVAEEIL